MYESKDKIVFDLWPCDMVYLSST